MEVSIAHHHFSLHPSGAMFWREQQMLLIADVHLGKVTHFRKSGVAVPLGAIEANFKQLDALLDHYHPATICFLGDLFHSDLNREWDFFADWVCRIQTPVVLIAGNHDVIPEHRYCEISVEVRASWQVGNFLLTHHPVEAAPLFNFCGHIHPCVRLQGAGRQYLKLPCFFRSAGQMILPAFGEFTGMYEMTPSESDRIYAVAGKEVIEVLVQGERRT